MWPFNRVRRQSEAGTAVVETALVFPVVILVLFGVFEIGAVMRVHLSIGNASGNGARAGSIAGTDAFADHDILREVRKAVSPLSDDAIERVVVFKAEEIDATAPDSCLEGIPVDDVCNVYESDELQMSNSESLARFASSTYTEDDNWPASVAHRSTNRTDLGFIGVTVMAHHRFATGMLGDNQDLSNTTVVRLEPEASYVD